MSFKHNKKRNAGLIYEFFIRSIGASVLDGNNETVSSAKKLFKKYFKAGTALATEARLFKTVLDTTGVSKDKASIILNHVKSIATKGDHVNETVLELEKTALIHEVNKTIGPQFFESEVPDFKDYASFQILLNNWRSPSLNESVEDLATLEEMLINRMQRSKPKVQNFSEMTQEQINEIVVEKSKEKIDNSLSLEQKHLLSIYVNDHISREVVIQEMNSQLEKQKKWLQENQASMPIDLCNKFQTVTTKLEKTVKEKQLNDKTVEMFITAIQIREEYKKINDTSDGVL